MSGYYKEGLWKMESDSAKSISWMTSADGAHGSLASISMKSNFYYHQFKWSFGMSED